jgi:hypothetical protein
MKDSDPPIPSAILFPYSFLILLIVSSPFFLYAWVMGHPFLKTPFFIAILQYILLTFLSAFIGALFVYANRHDNQAKTFFGWYFWRAANRFSFISFVVFWILFFYYWKQSAETICLELFGLGLWSLAVSILTSRKYRKRWWSLHWDKHRRLSRKQRERLEREALKAAKDGTSSG